MKKLLTIATLLCLSTCIWGCTASDNSDNDTPTTAISDPGSPDGENIPLIGNQQYQLLDDGYFVGGNLIYYHDFSEERSYVVCSQPGCDHKTTLCPALLGEKSGEYAFYQDTFYALTDDRIDGAWHYTLQSRAPDDAVWNVMWEYNVLTEGGINVEVQLGGGYAAICIDDVVLNGQEALHYAQLLAVDLDTGTVNEVIPRSELPNSGTYSLHGVAAGKAVLSWEDFDEATLSYDDYISEAALRGEDVEEADANWFSYIQSHHINRLLAVDLETGERTEIVSGMADSLPIPADSKVVYKDTLYYYENGALLSYSLVDSEITELMPVTDVIDIFALDGRVFYITTDDNGSSYCYYDLASGESHQLENEGIDDVMVYNIYYENSTMFLGLYQDKRTIISKEDFYHEDYDKATRVR